MNGRERVGRKAAGRLARFACVDLAGTRSVRRKPDPAPVAVFNRAAAGGWAQHESRTGACAA